MSHDSAVQIKVSSGWAACKSLGFYVDSFDMEFFSFSLYLEISLYISIISLHIRLS